MAKGSAGAGEAQSAAQEKAREVRFLKTYTVFNVAQIDGLPELFTSAVAEPPPLPVLERIAHADAFLGALGIEVRHGGGQAFYAASEDRIQLSALKAFHDVESYYTTLGHEAVHATRHTSRLNWDCGSQRFGDEGYAREELVAELGSAFPCGGPRPLPGAAGRPRRLSGAGRRAGDRVSSRAWRAGGEVHGRLQPQ